ncbi:trypsin alpha-3-like [Bacillus rossius redtenbacheri]|uniref:trypsin alpha-3-like n=1 Tax=Bacillus rossius redtenbacheri TaxID=93214 RepID=UPI002FDCA426
MRELLLVSCLLFSVYGASINDPYQLDGRIIGGYQISISNAPYQAAYELNGRQKCGASVISNNYALSAAHCSISDAVASVSIRVGTDQRASGGSVHKASQIINHEKYSTFPSPRFDISLIKVATPFVLSASVKAIPLATVLPAAGSAVATSGWGATSEGGSASAHLLQVQVNVLSQADCKRAYPLRITDQMFCAGVSGGGKDTCQGDSGGPLVHGGQLVGVVSWGVGCARARSPGVYASVPALAAWVKQHAGV